MKLRLGNRVDAAGAIVIVFAFAAAIFLLAGFLNYEPKAMSRLREPNALATVIGFAIGALVFLLGALHPRDTVPRSPFTRVVASGFLQVTTARVLAVAFAGIGLITGGIAVWFRYELLAIVTLAWCAVFFVVGLISIESAVFSRMRGQVAKSMILGSILGGAGFAWAIHEDVDRARLFAFVVEIGVGGIAGLGLSRRVGTSRLDERAEPSSPEGASGPRKSIPAAYWAFVAVVIVLLFVDLDLAHGYRPLERFGIDVYALLLSLALCRGSFRLVAGVGSPIALSALAGILFALDRLGGVEHDAGNGSLAILLIVIAALFAAAELAQIRDEFRVPKGRMLFNGLLGGLPFILFGGRYGGEFASRYVDSAVAVFDGRFDCGHGFAIHGLPLGLAIGFVLRERGAVVVLAMACAATGLAYEENGGPAIIAIAVLNSLASCLAFPSDTSRVGAMRNALGGLALLFTSLLPIVIGVGGIVYTLFSKSR